MKASYHEFLALIILNKINSKDIDFQCKKDILNNLIKKLEQ